LAHSVPTIATGYLAQKAGLLTAVNVYGTVIMVLVVLAITLLFKNARAPIGQAIPA